MIGFKIPENRHLSYGCYLDSFLIVEEVIQQSHGDNGGMIIEGQLSGKIIGAAIEVHRILGPGLLESSNEEALCYELSAAGLNFERQKPLPVVYKGIKLDCAYRLDLVVEMKVLLELKSVEVLLPIHEAQLLTFSNSQVFRLVCL